MYLNWYMDVLDVGHGSAFFILMKIGWLNGKIGSMVVSILAGEIVFGSGICVWERTTYCGVQKLKFCVRFGHQSVHRSVVIG